MLDRHYVYKICSPSRCALQSGRNPVHVNVLNDAIGLHNPSDLDAGQQGIPRNMTTIAAKLAGAGYSTHAVGKWVCRLRRTPSSTTSARCSSAPSPASARTAAATARARRSRTCALARAHTTDQAAPQRPNLTPGLTGGTRAWRGRT